MCEKWLRGFFFWCAVLIRKWNDSMCHLNWQVHSIYLSLFFISRMLPSMLFDATCTRLLQFFNDSWTTSNSTKNASFEWNSLPYRLKNELLLIFGKRVYSDGNNFGGKLNKIELCGTQLKKKKENVVLLFSFQFILRIRVIRWRISSKISSIQF